MSQVKVGSIIKSYDFVTSRDCYIIGIVRKIEDDLIYADVIEHISRNKVVDPKYKATHFETPMQGHMLMDSDDNIRIEVLV